METSDPPAAGRLSAADHPPGRKSAGRAAAKHLIESRAAGL